MTEYVREWEDRRRALVNEVLRGIEFALQPLASSLDAFLAELFSARLPSNWRERWHNFVAEQAELGFFIEPVSVEELETWIEQWAAYCELLPIEEIFDESVSFADAFTEVEGDRPFVITYTPDVSGPGPGDVSLGPDTPGNVVVKPQFPADSRGKWLSGTKGEGVFRYHDIPENRAVGLANTEIRFEGQYIAVGGFPADAYYGGSADAAFVEIEVVTGTGADNRAALQKMRIKVQDQTWKMPLGYEWNHAGPPGSKVMELVRYKYHDAVHHTGPAAAPRAARRMARVKGVTGRAIAIVNIYLVSREILMAAGAAKPHYEVSSYEQYRFGCADGSVFVVERKWWYFGKRIRFVDGPRNGEKVDISTAEYNVYKQQAEAKWGKYVPGGLFTEPTFMPGTDRKSLPLIRPQDGAEIGWIDEKGVHYHSRVPDFSI